MKPVHIISPRYDKKSLCKKIKIETEITLST